MKNKYEIVKNKDHYAIFYGKQRHIMTAIVWDIWIAELVCSTLNTWNKVSNIIEKIKQGEAI